MGMRPNTEFAEQFASFPNLKVLGTNVQYSSIAPATESGFMAAYELAGDNNEAGIRPSERMAPGVNDTGPA